MGRKKRTIGGTARDQAITDLEEISDLMSEVGTSLADQSLYTAAEQWGDVQEKYKALASLMRDVFKEATDEGSEDDD